MTAIRRIQRITIRIDENGVPLDVEAVTFVTATEDQLVVEGRKVYAEDYANLGVAAQGRVDGFVADVGTFIGNQEPIV